MYFIWKQPGKSDILRKTTKNEQKSLFETEGYKNEDPDVY